MVEIIHSSLLDPAELMRFVSVNLHYAMEEDSDTAVLMAKRVWAGSERLLVLAPAEMQQGGVGRGSGFSAVFETKYWVQARDQAKAFVETYAPVRSAPGSRMFGSFAADARFFHCAAETE